MYNPPAICINMKNKCRTRPLKKQNKKPHKKHIARPKGDLEKGRESQVFLAFAVIPDVYGWLWAPVAPLELLDFNSPLTSPRLCSGGQDLGCGSWLHSQSEAGKMQDTKGTQPGPIAFPLGSRSHLQVASTEDPAPRHPQFTFLNVCPQSSLLTPALH